MKKLNGNWERKIRRLRNYINFSMADEVGQTAVYYFDEAFEKEAWDGQPWPNRKREPRAGSRPTRGQKGLLVDTGETRRSIDHDKQGNKVVFSASRKIAGGHDLAQIHNQGKGHQPKRKFMGVTKELEYRIQRAIEESLKKLF
ncbi:phage virion morphogenesis protein [Xanthovirga aplysinae]|uniref:phage virion morphogenesis protein n=1 Tax=Xanthovirga aplysinae TaxID=2529853 RepID=UPI0012BD56A9|nr:phage virion morphogenesis protein [Xanthovirga aplysinae]MTI31415.1 hypothetical protein [Xanthovirga aplysinae]